ncbi:MAG TPA: hypothetical protein VIT18_05150 [Terrimicrobiaceae bacterium]
MAGPEKSAAGTATCNCGAVYEVTMIRTPFPDTDDFSCEVCRKKLDSWRQSTTWPSYKIIHRPPGK